MRSARRAVDAGGGSLASRHDVGSECAPAGKAGPNGTPECKHPYAFAARASHAFQNALAEIFACLRKQARGLVAVGPPIWAWRGGEGAPKRLQNRMLLDRKIDTRWCQKVGSICARKLVPFGPENWFHWAQKTGSIEPRKLVSVSRFAAPVLVPENGHDFGAVNRFPNNFTEGNRFTAPKSCPFSGTKTGAANRETETSFMGSTGPVFWVQWNQISGPNGTSFLVSMGPFF